MSEGGHYPLVPLCWIRHCVYLYLVKRRGCPLCPLPESAYAKGSFKPPIPLVVRWFRDREALTVCIASCSLLDIDTRACSTLTRDTHKLFHVASKLVLEIILYRVHYYIAPCAGDGLRTMIITGDMQVVVSMTLMRKTLNGKFEVCILFIWLTKSLWLFGTLWLWFKLLTVCLLQCYFAAKWAPPYLVFIDSAGSMV